MKARPSLRLPHGGDGKQRRGRVIVPSMLRCRCQKLGYTSRKQALGAASVSRGRPITDPEETPS